MSDLPKILIFVDWYVPGYRAGGPIRSVNNLAKQLSRFYDIYVFTGSKDFGVEEKYAGVSFDCWTKLDGHQVYYCDQKIDLNIIKSVIGQIQPQFVYLNSLFSKKFTLLPLKILKDYSQITTILAPRGMLGAGALKIKATKKKLFLFVTKIAGKFKNVEWHVTAETEKQEVLAYFPQAKLFVASNLATQLSTRFEQKEKKSGELNLVFISRVYEKKNILGAIRALNQGFKGQINYDIYGPMEDTAYWEECLTVAKELPKNVSISYKGLLKHEEIYDVLIQYHFLYFMTFNENFGHVIIEAMNCSCPVIISDQTPWRQLQSNKLGWDISNTDMPMIREAINHALDMEQPEYDEWAEMAYNFSVKQVGKDEVSRYKLLFS